MRPVTLLSNVVVKNAHYNIGADTGERAYLSMLSVACVGGTNLEAWVALSAQAHPPHPVNFAGENVY